MAFKQSEDEPQQWIDAKNATEKQLMPFTKVTWS